ncbi:HlyD family secretion protein [Candidatus Nitrosacidococcus sp. I8]|uniref:efflux RND transporter periplasmic adaptor subunit n=1 Tax=Candidatus Nitrosacidococcus sp. I8 TaxID=2942908 RepID=UPI002227A163|nr:HlyD family secretion protein [Candidatus Nitrosacidococcus sp. I8]CAH9018017.1 p-hydroxybenzoic acid efflux pump subunit AaeA [Candidatus Nitrosacidococcus sp. I8]
MNATSVIRFCITTIVVIIAVIAAWLLWNHYMYSPWTRDARVYAEVVKVAPDVSGLITHVTVKDNQQVRQGDLLFEIDQERFQHAVDQAQASLNMAKVSVKVADAEIKATKDSAAAAQTTYLMHHQESDRRRNMNKYATQEEQMNTEAIARAAYAQWQAALANHDQAKANKVKVLADIESAEVALAITKLDLARSKIYAPIGGYITNLDVYIGEYAHAGQAYMALVSRHNIWIYGYFEETKLLDIRVGNKADVRLMSGARFKGSVESIARGIIDNQNRRGVNLLADVNPTFNWVRLAQRIPVRIKIDYNTVPQDLLLAAGLTATVILHPVANK